MNQSVWMFYHPGMPEIRILFETFMVQISGKSGVHYNDYRPYNQQIALKWHRRDREWQEIPCSW